MKFQLFIKLQKGSFKIIIDPFFNKLLNLHKTSYDPHISLYYGNTSLINKKKIISSLKNFEKKIKIIKICLVKNDEKKLKWNIVKKFVLS